MAKKIKMGPEIKNFKELLEHSIKEYKENVAYKYKESLKEPVKYIEKTYEQVGKDVKALGTALLKENFSGKRIALIGANRYEWCVSYFAITCSGNLVAPMDKLLPENEIASLIKRSEVDEVICDEKYLEIFKKIKNDETNNLKTIICMDTNEDNEIITLESLIKKGNELLENSDNSFDKVQIDEENSLD